MDTGDLILLCAVGVVAGFINVMAGGGSLLTMPLMVFMGLSGPVVNGTNRVAILVQNVAAVYAFFRKGFSDFRLSLSLTLCALPGAVVGAMLGTRLEGVWFNRVLAGVMVGVMLLMLRKKGESRDRTRTESPRSPTRRRQLVAHLMMLGAGFYGGIIQAGVGFIMIAILHRTLGLDLVRVNMHKVFIIGVYTLVALSVFAWQGQVEWLIGLLLAAGNASGAWIGTHFAVKKGERLIRIVLNIALAAMAAKLLLSA
ncbi:MAG: sulfite exporter TauE/SafE family protein [Planctomycetes bacterium]|nr:sulfite exporter TauE/SafE family protein [Planctomycetota bacterium]